MKEILIRTVLSMIPLSVFYLIYLALGLLFDSFDPDSRLLGYIQFIGVIVGVVLSDIPLDRLTLPKGER